MFFLRFWHDVGQGPCRAKRIYERHVLPVLAAAGLEVAVVETQRRGHAGELAAGVDLQRCDLLVLVGGDGTVFDALQVPSVSHAPHSCHVVPCYRHNVTLPYKQIEQGKP